MMKSSKVWLVLNYINANRKGQEPITKENAKGMYIPEYRLHMEESFGKDLVTEIFGKPTHLETAESMLLEIEKGRIDWKTRYQDIISISYEIESVCGLELDSNNEVWEKYALLHSEIPIEVMSCDKKPFAFFYCKTKKTTICTKELEIAKSWLECSEAKVNLIKKLYIEYIFELVYLSLKEIFQEVKSEIFKK